MQSETAKPKNPEGIFMKRFFALFVCVATLLTLTACSKEQDLPAAEAPVIVTEPVAQTVAPTAAATEAPTEAPAAPALMGQTVLVDNEDVFFAITGVETSEHLGMQLHVECVNKTGRALIFSWDMVSVCGYMYDPLWSVEVDAGKHAVDAIELDTYALEKMGVLSVDEVTFTLRIFDSENWMEAPLVQQTFTVYPTGLNADTLVLPQHMEHASHELVADDENVRFEIESAGTGKDGQFTLSVFMQNKTDRNLMYAWDLVSVNGTMIDPFWASFVAAGKNACAEITFYGADLENSGIADVTDIEFTLIVSDYDDWESGNLLEETYTYRVTSVG